MPLQGDLASIPISEVIQLVAAGRRSGTLYVAAPDDARVFTFQSGRFFSATSLEQRFRLGHALCQRGLLDPSRLEEALVVQRTSMKGSSLGDVLLKQGAITREGLEATLRDQVQDALDDALHWPDGGFLFAEEDFHSGSAVGGFDVQPLLLESLRKLDEWQRISRAFDDRAAIIDFAESVGDIRGPRPAASDDALAILEHVDGRRSIASITSKVPWSEHRVIRALGSLLNAGLVRMKAPTDSAKFGPTIWQDRVKRVTVAPRAAARAVALASIESADAVEMHAAAMADPGLAVAVLRAATSIGRKEGAQFETLRDAVLALGDDVLRRVLVAAGLRGCYSRANRSHSAEVWRHSLVAAVGAARLAAALGMPAERGAEAYLCALLHDVGIQVLRGAVPEAYEQVEGLVAEGKLHRSEAERKVLGVGHDKVGAAALENWGAGASAIDVALSHHMGLKSEPWQLAIVQVADMMAGHCGFDAEVGGGELPAIEDVGRRALGLNPAQVKRVMDEIAEEASVRDPLW